MGDIKSKLDFLIELHKSDSKKSSMEKSLLQFPDSPTINNYTSSPNLQEHKIMQRNLSDPRHSRKKHLLTARSISKITLGTSETLKEEVEESPKKHAPSSPEIFVQIDSPFLKQSDKNESKGSKVQKYKQNTSRQSKQNNSLETPLDNIASHRPQLTVQYYQKLNYHTKSPGNVQSGQIK